MEKIYSIHKMRKEHIRGVVRLHLASFSAGYPLSFSEHFFNNMGKKYLTLFFKEFCKHDFNFGVVAIHEISNRIIGFLTVSANIEKQYKYFYSRHFFIIALIFFYKVVTNRVIRSGVGKKIISIKRAISSITNRDKANLKEFEESTESNSAYLMYIAVDKKARRAGIANAMINNVLKDLENKKITQIHSFVNTGNLNGNNYFKKCGWKELKKSNDGISYTIEIGS